MIRRGPQPVAVYRDPEGRVDERSAVCPHLGGIVAGNSSERTWDCPCHGARFEALGGVISGHATRDLAPAEP